MSGKKEEAPKAEEPKPAPAVEPVKPADPPKVEAPAAPKPAPKPSKAPEPPPEPGIVDALLDNPTALIGGGGVLALLLGLVAYRIRRNQAPAAALAAVPGGGRASRIAPSVHSTIGCSGRLHTAMNGVMPMPSKPKPSAPSRVSRPVPAAALRIVSRIRTTAASA